MSQKLKITWDVVQKLLPNNSNHDSLRMLASTAGNRVHIPINLFMEQEKVLSATVSLLPSQFYLYQPALAILKKKMNTHGIHLPWDSASFNGQEPIDRSKLLCIDSLSLIVSQSCDEELIDTLKAMRDRWKETDYGPLSNKVIDNLHFRELCGAIIGASAIVKSEDMEREIYGRPKGFFSRRYEPQNLEL